MGIFSRNHDEKDSREEEDREAVAEQADKILQRAKLLKLGREVEAHANLLKAKAAELRKVLEQSHG